MLLLAVSKGKLGLLVMTNNPSGTPRVLVSLALLMIFVTRNRSDGVFVPDKTASKSANNNLFLREVRHWTNFSYLFSLFFQNTVWFLPNGHKIICGETGFFSSNSTVILRGGCPFPSKYVTLFLFYISIKRHMTAEFLVVGWVFFNYKSEMDNKSPIPITKNLKKMYMHFLSYIYIFLSFVLLQINERRIVQFYFVIVEMF